MIQNEYCGGGKTFYKTRQLSLWHQSKSESRIFIHDTEMQLYPCNKFVNRFFKQQRVSKKNLCDHGYYNDIVI